MAMVVDADAVVVFVTFDMFISFFSVLFSRFSGGVDAEALQGACSAHRVPPRQGKATFCSFVWITGADIKQKWKPIEIINETVHHENVPGI